MPRTDPQVGENALHRLPIGLGEVLRLRDLSITDQLGKSARDLSHGQDEVSQTRRDRAAWH